MSKTKKRNFLKRRKTRKMIGGTTPRGTPSGTPRGSPRGSPDETPSCPVCFENKPLLKMEHALDGAHPTAEIESLVDHKMCKDCFKRLNPKNCPLCRRPVVKLIDMVDNHQAWPVIPRGPPIITELMVTHLNGMPATTSKGHKWTFESWMAYINDPNNNNPFFQQFYDRLSDLPVEQLTNMYKTVVTYKPSAQVAPFLGAFEKYSKKHGRPEFKQTILKKKLANDLANIELIKEFLSYILVVEVAVGQDYYFERIPKYFGWVPNVEPI